MLFISFVLHFMTSDDHLERVETEELMTEYGSIKDGTTSHVVEHEFCFNGAAQWIA